MTKVNKFIYFILIALFGYGIAYIQFTGEQNPTLIDQIVTAKFVEPVNHNQQLNQRRIEKQITNKINCIDQSSMAWREPYDETNMQQDMLDLVEQRDSVISVYSSEEYSEKVEKKIIPKATQVMIAIPESEQEDLIEIIETQEQESEWGHRFENKITHFVTENDINSAIDISLLICKTNYCRMEVMINNEQDWLMLFKQMSEQNWWNVASYKALTQYDNNQSIILYRLDNDQFSEQIENLAFTESYSNDSIDY